MCLLRVYAIPISNFPADTWAITASSDMSSSVEILRDVV